MRAEALQDTPARRYRWRGGRKTSAAACRACPRQRRQLVYSLDLCGYHNRQFISYCNRAAALRWQEKCQRNFSTVALHR
jgi:hypothetical protein